MFIMEDDMDVYAANANDSCERAWHVTKARRYRSLLVLFLLLVMIN